MPWLEPTTLRGAHAGLKPLSQDHCEGLTEAVKDGELWKLWYTFIPRAEDMRKEIDRRLGLQAARSSSARISSTTRAGAASSGWAPSRMAFFATIRSRQTEPCATRWFTVSSP